MIISSFLGETASNLRRLFEFAARKPCILFLDEFDALARTRADAAEHNELRRVVNSLLLMIERFKGPGLVIAATNLPQFLDEALWRRFDDILLFELPTEREIGLLLAREFANFPAHFDLTTPISKLIGMSYAEIERICIDAIKKAVLKKRRSVSETEFAAALRQESPPQRSYFSPKRLTRPMANLPHLPLQRLDRTEDRRKLPAPVAPPVRGSAGGHAAVITGKIDAVAAEQNALPKIEGIDPELFSR